MLSCSRMLMPMVCISQDTLSHCSTELECVATNGLDDLRSWTLKGIIQDHIDIYLSTECFDEIKRAFPYLVSKGFATGGGDVPDFRWHIIEPNAPFSIGAEDEFWITPIYGTCARPIS